jgi:protein-disulfide isomerase
MSRIFITTLLLAALSCATPALNPQRCVEPDLQEVITYCVSPQAADIARAQANGVEPPISVAASPSIGPADASITLVMFTDLRCPFCRESHRDIVELVRRNSDTRLVFKHLPLPSHPDAVPAALGALVAEEDGKFWSFVDLCLETEGTLEPSGLKAIREEAGIDEELWMKRFGDEEHFQIIERDLTLAHGLGVQATPTLFVNGLRMTGAPDIAVLQATIDGQRDLAKRLTNASVPPEQVSSRLTAAQYTEASSTASAVEEHEEGPGVTVVYVPLEGSPIKGARTDATLVTIVVFSDFECPYCASTAAALDRAMEQFGDHVRLAFRHFPLAFHERAIPLSLAAIRGGEQGLFWQAHDRFFAGPPIQSDEDIDAISRELGIQVPKGVDGHIDPAALARIEEDIQLGQALGVQGTPTLFINGMKLEGAAEEAFLYEVIGEQIRIATGLQEKTGLVGEDLYQAMVFQNETELGGDL